MKLIILNGPAGVGKSTLSERLHADISNSVLIHVDDLRRTIPNYRENCEESLMKSYEITRKAIKDHLENGETVIIDKAVASSDTLDSFIETGKQRGADVYEIFLAAAKDVVWTRADERGYKPGSLLTRERVGELWDKLDDVRQKRPSAIVIDTNALSLDETYQKVKEVIS